MKIKFLVILTCLMLSSFVVAIGPNASGPATDKMDSSMAKMNDTGKMNSSDKGPMEGQMDDPKPMQTAVQNEGEETQIKEQVRAEVQTLKQEMQQNQEQMDKDAQEMGGKKGEVLMKQNQVKTAAQTLSKMANMMGGIGDEVSEIAKGFENSVQSTIKAEEKIQTRSGFARFFTGGDHKAAEEMEKEVTQNQDRIKELKQLKDQCTDCEQEVEDMLQEQIQTMEQEQTRLQTLAQDEKKSKGIIGWIWKWG